ncbi:MAG: hypothetical protein LCH61_18760 [Proteobacteria bacterium]|nr:hypothetical protein [Pseudomonadota bacterium]
MSDDPAASSSSAADAVAANAAGGAPETGKPVQGTAPAVAAGADAAAGAAAVYRPKGLDESLIGASDQETIDKLFKSYGGLRAKLSTQGQAPESPDGYEIKFEGDLAPYTEKLSADPVFADIRKAFHAAGVPKASGEKVVALVMQSLQTGGLLEKPFNADAEMAALAPDISDAAERKAAVHRMVSENQALLDGFRKSGMPEAAYNAALELQDRAGGVQLVQWMKGQGKAPGPLAGGGAPGGGPVTREQLQARRADPRDDYTSTKFDPAFAAETVRLYQQLEAQGA